MTSFDSQICYPRSFANYQNLSRSRVLSEDIATFWNVQITGIESVEDRARKYHLFFSLKIDQIRCIHARFLKELVKASSSRVSETRENSSLIPACSIKLSDAFLSGLPDFNMSQKEQKIVFHLHEKVPTLACASLIRFNKQSGIEIKEETLNLKEESDSLKRDLLDSSAPAMALFDCLAGLIKTIIKKHVLPSNSRPKIGMAIGFPMEQRSLSEATLLQWTKGFATGRKTEDPAEGISINALMNCALKRAKLDCQISCVINDAVAVYLTACYEKPSTLPQCAVGFTIGYGVNLCYFLPEAKSSLGFSNSLIVCDIGGFDMDLPTNDVDVEINFQDELYQKQRYFEMMVSVEYLEELCRCVVIKVWQSEAPRLAWVHHSMPWLACISIIEDEDENLSSTEKCLSNLWDWEITLEQRRALRELFQAIFERAAMLSAVAVSSAATQTGLLQPAMGGCVVGIAGCLFECSKFFRENFIKYCKSILPVSIAPLLHTYLVKDGVAKGAALAMSIQ